MFRILLELVKVLPSVIPLVIELLRRKRREIPIDPVEPPVVPPADPPKDPPIDPSPPPHKKPTDYIPLKDKEIWALNVERAYSVWRGDRDLAFLLSHPEVVADLKFDEGRLKHDIVYMQAEHEKQKALAHRIRSEKHPEFKDRSKVKKSVANEMIAHMQEVSAIYTDYQKKATDLGVVWGVQFDSFQGFIVDNEDPQFNTERYNAWKKRKNS